MSTKMGGLAAVEADSNTVRTNDSMTLLRITGRGSIPRCFLPCQPRHARPRRVADLSSVVISSRIKHGYEAPCCLFAPGGKPMKSGVREISCLLPLLIGLVSTGGNSVAADDLPKYQFP